MVPAHKVLPLLTQVHTEQKNGKKLKELYGRALAVKSAIPHPRIMGVIRECGGKMHMHERAWSDAATDFFEVSHARPHGLPFSRHVPSAGKHCCCK